MKKVVDFQTKSIPVKISPSELSLLKFFSKERHNRQRSRNIATQKADPTKNDLEIDLIGAVGEYAACKCLGIAMQTNIDQGTDFGIDFKLGNLTVDVKTTYSRMGRLSFRELTKFKSDLAILVYVNKDDLSDTVVIGFIDRDTFNQNAVNMDLGGYGRPSYVVEQSSLESIRNIKRVFEYAPIHA
jgi:hypothetical protein